MSTLSAFDGDPIGFDSVSVKSKIDIECSTQTTEYSISSSGTQAITPKSCEIQTSAGDTFEVQYNPENLNRFLKKVSPLVLDVLSENEHDYSLHTSESEDEETVHARLYQVLDNTDICSRNSEMLANENPKTLSVLSLSWSSAGNTLALALGNTHHEDWCDHEGVIRVYTIKRSAGDKLKHSYDITQKNCITALQYHPSISALLAFASISGEVVVQNLRNAKDMNLGDGAVLSSPHGCHGSRRVSALKWADPRLTIRLLSMQSSGLIKRRGASDQVLISTGSDGSINVWQVNPNLDVFNNIICYQLGLDSHTPDITCFDFVRDVDHLKNINDSEGDIFVVGCKSGQLILCNSQGGTQRINSDLVVNPTIGLLEPHHTCVLEVAFSYKRLNIFASISTDSELRIYKYDQPIPLKVICVDETLSCMAWVPNNPNLIALGLGKVGSNGKRLMVYNILSGKPYAIEGLNIESSNTEPLKKLSTTALAINTCSQNLISVGDNEGNVCVWDIPIPIHRISCSTEGAIFG